MGSQEVKEDSSLLGFPPSSSPHVESSSRIQHSDDTQHPRRFSKGLFVGICCVVIAAAGNLGLSLVLQAQERETRFNYPAFTIYWNHSWLALHCLVAWLLACRRMKRERSGAGILASPLEPFRELKRQTGWSNAKLAWVATILAFLYMLPNILWAETVVLQLTPAFVLVFSALFLKTKVELVSVASIVSTMCGVGLVAWGNNPSSETQEKGSGTPNASAGVGFLTYVMLAAAPPLFATFQLAFQGYSKRLRSTETISALTASIGVVNILTMWPFIPLIGYCSGNASLFPLFFDAEAFEQPKVSEYVFSVAGLATVYNFAFMLGNAIASPLFMAMGAVWNLPISVITDDFLLDTQSLNVQTVAGSVLVGVGFVGITLAMHRADARRPEGVGKSEQRGEKEQQQERNVSRRSEDHMHTVYASIERSNEGNSHASA